MVKKKLQCPDCTLWDPINKVCVGDETTQKGIYSRVILGLMHGRRLRRRKEVFR